MSRLDKLISEVRRIEGRVGNARGEEKKAAVKRQLEEVKLAQAKWRVCRERLES